jgi:plastocyanin
VRRALVAAVVLVLAVVPVAAGRKRRLHLPTPPLAHSLSVDAIEWALRPSKVTVAAGPVRIHFYNRGEDAHNLTVVDGSGVAHVLLLQPGADGVITPSLAPGHYHFFCSLFAGTPQSHETRGMWFNLNVQ